MRKTCLFFSFRFAAFVVVLVAAAGCINSKNPVTVTSPVEPVGTTPAPPATQSTPLPTEPLDIVPSDVPHPTNTVTARATETPTGTWTPFPTLNPEGVEDRVIELYSQMQNCVIPCWWGITPGITTWQEAHEILAPLATDLYEDGNADINLNQFVIRIPEGIGFPKSSNAGDFYSLYFDPALFIKDEIVGAINLSAGWISSDLDYTLAGFLSMLGEPDEIWFRIEVSGVEEYSSRFALSLFYYDGIMLSTNGEALQEDDSFLACPLDSWNNETPPSVLLWSSELEVGFQDIEQQLFGGIRTLYLSEFSRISEYSDELDEEVFHNLYVKPNAESCLEVPGD